MSSHPLLASLDEVLAEGEAFLTGLSDEHYAHAGADGASIGAHYRHGLEHFKLLFEAVNEPVLDYDRRARDRRLEEERLFALQTTRDFRHAARFLTHLPLDRAIEARCQISHAGPGTAPSTLGREIMFVISHAMHHYALIGLICAARKIPVPEHFGLAPSTLAYQKRRRTA